MQRQSSFLSSQNETEFELEGDSGTFFKTEEVPLDRQLVKSEFDQSLIETNKEDQEEEFHEVGFLSVKKWFRLTMDQK